MCRQARAGGPNGVASSGSVDVSLQGVESVVPLVGERSQELLGELHGGGAQPVANPAALAGFRGDEAGFGHESEMLGDRLAGDRQSLSKVADGGRAIAG